MIVILEERELMAGFNAKYSQLSINRGPLLIGGGGGGGEKSFFYKFGPTGGGGAL